MNKMPRSFFAISSVIVLILSSSSAFADSSINVGNHDLLPNLADQTVELFSTGDDAIRGFNLRAQIGDGADGLTEPVFDAIEFGGGIWDAYPFTTLGGPVDPLTQFAQASVEFNETGNTVVSSGKIATLVISTLGITEGEFDLLLAETQIGEDSDFNVVGGGTVLPSIVNGTIRIVPEMGGCVLFLHGALSLIGFRRGLRETILGNGN